jgi:hypothetical protein
MDIGSIQHIIGNVFFPIVMVIYFVCRFEKILTHNTEAINAMLKALELIIGQNKTK